MSTESTSSNGANSGAKDAFPVTDEVRHALAVTKRGVDELRARDLTAAVIGGLEGAFLLSRTLRSVEPLRAAGRVLAPQYRGIALGRVSLPQKVGGRAVKAIVEIPIPFKLI